MNKQGIWSLAPAFDMTFSYRRDSMWVSSHQMLINGKSEEISQEDLFAVAKQAGIKKAEAVAGMEQVRDAISKWSGFADEAELSRNRTGLIQSQFKW